MGDAALTDYISSLSKGNGKATELGMMAAIGDAANTFSKLDPKKVTPAKLKQIVDTAVEKESGTEGLFLNKTGGGEAVKVYADMLVQKTSPEKLKSFLHDVNSAMNQHGGYEKLHGEVKAALAHDKGQIGASLMPYQSAFKDIEEKSKASAHKNLDPDLQNGLLNDYVDKLKADEGKAFDKDGPNHVNIKPHDKELDNDKNPMMMIMMILLMFMGMGGGGGGGLMDMLGGGHGADGKSGGGIMDMIKDFMGGGTPSSSPDTPATGAQPPGDTPPEPHARTAPPPLQLSDAALRLAQAHGSALHYQGVGLTSGTGHGNPGGGPPSGGPSVQHGTHR